MKIATEKKVWWCALAVGIGGTVIFLIALAEHDFSFPKGREAWLNLWPLTTLLLALVAPFRLRKLYREEPFAAPGFYHLSLGDLLCVSFYCGLILALGQDIWPDYFLAGVVPAMFMACAAFVAGLLLAARRGLPDGWRRRLFAFGFSMEVYGAFGTGGVLVLLVVAAFMGAFAETLREVCFGSSPGPLTGLGPFFRAALVCLPLGLLLCFLAKRRRGHAASTSRLR
jgi:hypothetical protein